MARKFKLSLWIVGAAAIAIVVALIVKGSRGRLVTTIVGTVLVQDADPAKQVPIPNVEIMASDDSTAAASRSQPSGFFRLNLHTAIWHGNRITLKFRHPDYDPLDISGQFGDRLCVARMVPRASSQHAESDEPETLLADLRVRYAITNLTSINVGSMARPFEIQNIGGIPCDRRRPCSPDHKWKAATNSESFDAGEGNQFNNVRLSCIAGPCPFTRVDLNRRSHGGRTVDVSVLNWSDTVTFLFEAEVIHVMPTDAIRQSYPTIFGRNMSFTLPATAQGLSIEAEMDGTAVVFPLGPDLGLSWAVCNRRIAPDETRLYTCELKPGYRFR